MIVLSWPPSILSPNARCHWAAKAIAVREYRTACWAATACQAPRFRGKIDKAAKIALKIVFHPPSRRRMDLDGCLSRLKSGLDGIADALGVDDSRFTLQIEMGEPVKGGEVLVMING